MNSEKCGGAEGGGGKWGWWREAPRSMNSRPLTDSEEVMGMNSEKCGGKEVGGGVSQGSGVMLLCQRAVVL